MNYILCDSSAEQTIHMKCQTLFSLKKNNSNNDNKKIECRLLQFRIAL